MSNKALTYEQVKTIASNYTDIITKESHGAQMIFTVYGGRLLGMWPKIDGHNPLWVNPHLKEVMKNGQWNIGGERLWIAPERWFFYENPRDFEGFHVPAEIDPGEYTGSDKLSFESTFSLLDYNKSITYESSVCKRQFELIDDPYASNIPFAGVRITDSVAVAAPGLEIAAWSIAQVYTCGPKAPATALSPAKRGSSFLSYMQPIPANRAEVLDGYARFQIDAAEVYKFSLRPEDMLFDNPCKTVYLTPAPDCKSWLCLIKRGNEMPRNQSECVDIARDNPDGPKGAIQSYNSGPVDNDVQSDYPHFGEIELQLKKSVTKGKRSVSAATHELLAYEGSKEELIELASKALNIASQPKLY